jgi:hypothetical protein
MFRKWIGGLLTGLLLGSVLVAFPEAQNYIWTSINGVPYSPSATVGGTLSIGAGGAIDMGNAAAIRTGTTAGDTLLLQAYDTDTGPAYTTLLTLTAGTTPSMTANVGAMTPGGTQGVYAGTATLVRIFQAAAGAGGQSVGENVFVGGSGNSTMTNGAGITNLASYNSSLGFDAFIHNTTGQYNTAMGHGALHTNTIGNYNTAIGGDALKLNTEGSTNTAVGVDALLANTTGSSNTAVGNNALIGTTIGGTNSALGVSALAVNSSGAENTAVGASALAQLNANYNTAVGSAAGYPLTSGSDNTFIGARSGAEAGQKLDPVGTIAIGKSAITTADNTAVIGAINITDAYFGSATGAANIHAKDGYFGLIATQDVIKILPVTSATRFTGTLTTTGDLTADRTYQLTDYSGIAWVTGERFQRPHVLAATDWTAIDLGDGTTNYVLGGAMGVITYREEQNKTVRSWVENSTGLNLDADATVDNEGVEILLADGVGATLGDGWFTTGTTGGCFEVTIQIGNISATDQVLVGFRQTEAFDAANDYTAYTNWAVIGLRTTDGAIVATGERAGGGTLTNDATGVTWADGETKTLKYCISTARAVTAYVDGVAVTLTNSGAAMTTAINMAPFVSYMHGAEAADPNIYITRWAFYRQ